MDNLMQVIKGLNNEDQIWLMNNGIVRNISKANQIIAVNANLNKMYFVLKGLFAVGEAREDQFLIIGPGGILGAMTFLSKEITTISVKALEMENTVLEISYESIESHCATDQAFAMRFYNLLANFLGGRLKNVLLQFINKSKQDSALQLKSPLALFKDDQPNFALIQHTLSAMQKLSFLVAEWEEGKEISQALIEREKRLSVATMGADSLILLLKIISAQGVGKLTNRIIQHLPSMTSQEKQNILPAYQIQKTITILMGGYYILCSNIENVQISHRLLSRIAKELNIKYDMSNTYINPASFIPEIELGLLRGMVSTFFPPGKITQLSLVCFIQPKLKKEQDVAISISPVESVLVPGNLFQTIIQKYAESAYPYLPFKIYDI